VIRDGIIVHVVEYEASPTRVWHALTDPSELAIWLMPNAFVASVGHRFTFDASPVLGTIEGEVLEVEEARLLRCRWSGAFGDTVVTFELEPAGEGTRVRLTHAGWRDDERGGFDQGWGDKLGDDLPRLLKGGTHS